MFEINDIVAYGSHGVCTISEIAEREMDRKQVKYYILKPIHDDNSTISIPVQNEKLTMKMRPTLSRNEINEMLKALPTEDTNWIENQNMRVTRCKEVIGSGNIRDLLVQLKTLYLHKQNQEELNKKLHMVDDRILKATESLLCNEFTYVLDVTNEQVHNLIEKYMP